MDFRSWTAWYGILKETKVINNSSYRFRKSQHKTTFNICFLSFRFLPFFSILFIWIRHKIVIVIDESVSFIKQQENILNNAYPLLKRKESSDFIILNVMDKTSIFKLKNLIEQGCYNECLFRRKHRHKFWQCYFSKSYIPIQFLNNTIYVKKWIWKISRFTRS